MTYIGYARATIHKMDEETVRTQRDYLRKASEVIFTYLDQQYGSYKNAPDDHPLWEAVNNIGWAESELPDEDEEDREAA
jgi:hypothetical protein